jgi:hypothetical protein
MGEREKRGKWGWEQASKVNQLLFLLSLSSPAPLAVTHLPPIKLGSGSSRSRRTMRSMLENAVGYSLAHNKLTV